MHYLQQQSNNNNKNILKLLLLMKTVFVANRKRKCSYKNVEQQQIQDFAHRKQCFLLMCRPYQLLGHRSTLPASVYWQEVNWENKALHQNCPALANWKKCYLKRQRHIVQKKWKKHHFRIQIIVFGSRFRNQLKRGFETNFSLNVESKICLPVGM